VLAEELQNPMIAKLNYIMSESMWHRFRHACDDEGPHQGSYPPDHHQTNSSLVSLDGSLTSELRAFMRVHKASHLMDTGSIPAYDRNIRAATTQEGYRHPPKIAKHSLRKQFLHGRSSCHSQGHEHIVPVSTRSHHNSKDQLRGALRKHITKQRENQKLNCSQATRFESENNTILSIYTKKIKSCVRHSDTSDHDIGQLQGTRIPLITLSMSNTSPHHHPNPPYQHKPHHHILTLTLTTSITLTIILTLIIALFPHHHPYPDLRLSLTLTQL
jgi:hypothetical protein